MKKFIPYTKQPDTGIKPEDDYLTAKRFKHISVGSTYFFFRGLFNVKYIPIKDISRCYKRVECCSPGCGRNSFNSKFLIIVTPDGEQKKLFLDNGIILDRVIDELKKQNADISVGFYQNESTTPP